MAASLAASQLNIFIFLFSSKEGRSNSKLGPETSCWQAGGLKGREAHKQGNLIFRQASKAKKD